MCLAALAHVTMNRLCAPLNLGCTPAAAAAAAAGEISPLLPASCRFFPTCSEYAAQAFRQYGAARGVVLTAWRLLRCNPLGPSGYDPPCWPPRWKGPPLDPR